MTDMHAELLVEGRDLLGEGPLWVSDEGAIYWVDIKGRRVNRHVLGGGTNRWTVPFRIMSLAQRAGGGFVGGSDRGVVAFGADFSVSDLLCDPESAIAANRLNDGKVDRAGRFWFGSMDDTEHSASGALYRLDAKGVCIWIDDGYRVTNGPAFSVDGRIMYHSDSALQIIYRYSLSTDGAVENKQVFAHFGAGEGYPDGMTVDAEDCLWVAFWDGWCVRRIASDGRVMARIPMPVARPTSVAFGGPQLDQLFITSATIGLDAAALYAQPAAGGLLRLAPGVRGVAAVPFAS